MNFSIQRPKNPILATPTNTRNANSPYPNRSSHPKTIQGNNIQFVQESRNTDNNTGELDGKSLEKMIEKITRNLDELQESPASEFHNSNLDDLAKRLSFREDKERMSNIALMKLFIQKEQIKLNPLIKRN
jgi:hypothetical protein